MTGTALSWKAELMDPEPHVAIREMHESLDSRQTPEWVVGRILALIGGQLPGPYRRMLERAANSRPAFYSSMLSDFERPASAEHQVRVLARIVGDGMAIDVDAAVGSLANDPERLAGEMRILAPFVGWQPNMAFKNRLDREARAAAGIQTSRRKYNRLIRHLNRTQAKVERQRRQDTVRRLMLAGRSGLASHITFEAMCSDVDAACFVAYWVANRNRRRQFTLAGRDNPMDDIAELLLTRCIDNADITDWYMIALAYPKPEVVARLKDWEKGRLLGRWTALMRQASDLLRELQAAWPMVEKRSPVDTFYDKRPGLRPPAEMVCVVDRSRMTVRAGIDSSTWNTLAQAYNTARSGWINALTACGALEGLDVACPPKVMRLMAADLVAWHGAQLHVDTAVAAALPWPWEVLDGSALCTREDVEDACAFHGVDPERAGWTAPRAAGAVAAVKATPELVHGVEVYDPLWAGLLRRAGAFSGKGIKDGYQDLTSGYPTMSHGGDQ